MERRGLTAGLIAGLLGLAMALLGDAFLIYKGVWVYLALVPGAAVAVAMGPWAGLVAGLLTGAAGLLPGLAVAVGLWMALVGWLAARRPDRRGQVGLRFLLTVPLALAPLVALGFGLGDQRDPLQVVPLAKSLALALVPSALALGVLGLLGEFVWRKWGARPVAVGGVLLLAVAMPFTAPEFRYPAKVVPAATVPLNWFRAAYAQADISPSPEMLAAGVHLGGYGGRSGPAQGVHDPIYFRVMALEQGSTRVIFVQTDTVGMGNRLYQRLRAEAADVAGTEHVLIGSTHTHAGPDLQGIWGGVPAAYEDFLTAQLADAVSEAVSRLEPVDLKAGRTRLQVARNRRDWGVVPEEMNVLQAVAPGGRTVATLINFSVHPTVLPRENMAISSDFVGPMLAAVGGPALFFNGAQGDVLPDTAGISGTMYEKAEAFGHRLAAAASSAAHTAVPVAPGGISVKSLQVHAPLENWQLQLAMSLGLARYDVAHRSVLPGVRTSITAIRLGDEVTMVTVPGEMMTRLWAKVEEGLPPGQHFVLGLTQDSLGYIITHDEWMTGRNDDYEETVSLGPVMGPLVEKAVLQLVR